MCEYLTLRFTFVEGSTTACFRLEIIVYRHGVAFEVQRFVTQVTDSTSLIKVIRMSVDSHSRGSDWLILLLCKQWRTKPNQL